MLKHENPNIEIINRHLWAVRYTLIPVIPQINYKPDPHVPIDRIPAQLSPDGIIVLNKDFKYYERLKNSMPYIMRVSRKRLKKEQDDFMKSNPAMSVENVLYQFMVSIELCRRDMKKGSVA